MMKSIYICCAIILQISIASFAQNTRELTLEQAISEALDNNLLIKSSVLNAESQHSLIGTSFDLPKTNVSFTKGQYNTAFLDNSINISQTVSMPGVYSSQKKYLTAQANLTTQQTEISKNELKYQVKQLFYNIQFLQNKAELLQKQDSIYSNFAKAGSIRFKTGESNFLEKVSSETQLMEIRNLIQQNESDLITLYAKLQSLINSHDPINIKIISAIKREYTPIIDTNSIKQNPTLSYFQKSIEVSNAFTKTIKKTRLPDFNIAYFNQTLTGWQNSTFTGNDVFYGSSTRFQGFTVGLSVPIWLKPYQSKISSASIQEKIATQNLEYYHLHLKTQYQSALNEYNKSLNTLTFYENKALKQSDLIFLNAQKAFKSGEIGYIEYSNALNQALTIQNNHLTSLLKFNLSVVTLEYIIGK